MKRNQKGFSLVEILILIVVIGLIAGVGYYVWQRNNSTDQNAQTSQSDSTTSDKNSSQVGANDSILDPTDYIDSYQLPQGWSEKECHEGTIAVIPTGTPIPECKADQPRMTVVIYIGDNMDYIDPEDCTVTKTKQDTNYGGFVSYDCENIQVDGKKGIRQVLKENEKGWAGKDNTQTSYIFPADGKLLTVAYIKYTDGSTPDHTNSFDNFVKSFKFQ